jgi:hypothetical protein
MGHGFKGYTVAQETKCDKWFSRWADKYLDNAFRQKTFEIDWSGTTNGKNCLAELKDRSGLLSSEYDDCFIEADKIANLLFDYIYNGNEPLYFSMYQDKLLCWNLRKLPSGIPPIQKRRARNPELEKELNNRVKELTGQDLKLQVFTETQKGLLPISDAIAYDPQTMERIK